MAAASKTAGEAVIGITLRQTAKFDENGESLPLPVKKDEYMAVSPGQMVPVLTKGIVMIDAKGLTDCDSDSSLKAGAAIHAFDNGELSTKTTTGLRVGTVLAIGSRTKQGPSTLTFTKVLLPWLRSKSNFKL